MVRVGVGRVRGREGGEGRKRGREKERGKETTIDEVMGGNGSKETERGLESDGLGRDGRVRI